MGHKGHPCVHAALLRDQSNQPGGSSSCGKVPAHTFQAPQVSTRHCPATRHLTHSNPGLRCLDSDSTSLHQGVVHRILSALEHASRHLTSQVQHRTFLLFPSATHSSGPQTIYRWWQALCFSESDGGLEELYQYFETTSVYVLHLGRGRTNVLYRQLGATGTPFMLQLHSKCHTHPRRLYDPGMQLRLTGHSQMLDTMSKISFEL